jgi:hypothetical protein
MFLPAAASHTTAPRGATSSGTDTAVQHDKPVAMLGANGAAVQHDKPVAMLGANGAAVSREGCDGVLDDGVWVDGVSFFVMTSK